MKLKNNYSCFKSSNEYVEPNVSFISEDGVVYFNPVDNSMKVFCTFNVTSDKNKGDSVFYSAPIEK